MQADLLLRGWRHLYNGLIRLFLRHPEITAREGITRLTAWLRSIGMPVTLGELEFPAEDIPAVVAHRWLKPRPFPFGGLSAIGPEDMEAILRLAAQPR